MRHAILYAVVSVLGLPIFAAESKPPKPCTIKSPSTGDFYDLNAITVHPLKDHKKAHKDDRTESWHSRGYDYGTNFTINFCAPVVERMEDVVGVDKALWHNVSAFYTLKGKKYSIGQASAEPIFRGRKLVLNYTDGSPCDDRKPLRRAPRREKEERDDDEEEDDEGDKRKHEDDDTDDERADKKKSTDESKRRRKSTLLSLTCDRESLAAKAHVSFIGASPDECTYFFEVKSIAACGGVIQDTQQTLGPGGVFGVTALIAAAVYFLGGIAYQRTVMHQRGWRQLPNYAIWAGIGSFCYDVVIIITSSCSRCLPRRRGYNQLPTSSRGGRNSRSEQENRLIDQLDEEWDD